jgi:hypothetical protein
MSTSPAPARRWRGWAAAAPGLVLTALLADPGAALAATPAHALGGYSYQYAPRSAGAATNPDRSGAEGPVLLVGAGTVFAAATAFGALVLRRRSAQSRG